MRRPHSKRICESGIGLLYFRRTTVDHQTLEDNTVTIRERDTMKQDRVSIDEISKIVLERLIVAI